MNQVNKEIQRAMNLKQVGASFFDTSATVKYGQHRLEIWPGITSTIRSREYHPLICIEPTHKVVRYAFQQSHQNLMIIILLVWHFIIFIINFMNVLYLGMTLHMKHSKSLGKQQTKQNRRYWDP